jgi:SAM-dependent methyltransferase
MNRDELLEARNRIVERHGEWTAHTIHLGCGVYTRSTPVNQDTLRLERLRQSLRDFGYQSLEGVRILDLGCLEGLFAIELARAGAKTVGIEARLANLEKARFAREALELAACELVQDDVRNLCRAKYGSFDIVLCCGILYHLDMPDALRLIQRISEVTEQVAVVETHVALEVLKHNPFELGELEEESWEGQVYQGRRFREHKPGETPQQKERRLWASLDNPRSFWLTRSSLRLALRRYGFESIYEQLQPPDRAEEEVDRVTWIGVKWAGRAERPSQAAQEASRSRLESEQQRAYMQALQQLTQVNQESEQQRAQIQDLETKLAHWSEEAEKRGAYIQEQAEQLSRVAEESERRRIYIQEQAEQLSRVAEESERRRAYIQEQAEQLSRVAEESERRRAYIQELAEQVAAATQELERSREAINGLRAQNLHQQQWIEAAKATFLWRLHERWQAIRRRR